MCLCSFARVRAACERRLSREIARQRFVSNSNSLGERSLKSVAARLRDNGDVRPSTWCAGKNVFVLRSLVWHRYASSSLSLPRGTSSSPGSWHRSSRDALLTAGTLLAACLETGALRPWTDPLDWSRRPAGNERVARLEHPPVLSCRVKYLTRSPSPPFPVFFPWPLAAGPLGPAGAPRRRAVARATAVGSMTS